jgi:DNA-binding transcriptional ArsR family regulator
MKYAEDIADPRVIKALSHPLRVQILGMLDGTVRSPKEIASELSEPLGNVSYHVRTLADLGLIELVKKVPRRGAIEHYYRAPERHVITDDEWVQLPRSVRRTVAGSLLAQISTDVGDGAAKGAFDADDAHLSRTVVHVDEAGRRKLADELAKFLDRAMKIGEASKNGNEELVDMNLVFMLFERGR